MVRPDRAATMRPLRHPIPEEPSTNLFFAIDSQLSLGQIANDLQVSQFGNIGLRMKTRE